MSLSPFWLVFGVRVPPMMGTGSGTGL